MQHERRLSKGSSRSHSTLSFLRKELQDANLRFSCGGSSYTLTSSNAAPDPLLSSFIFSLPEVEPSKDVQAVISDEESTVDEISDDKVENRYEILAFSVELYSSFFHSYCYNDCINLLHEICTYIIKKWVICASYCLHIDHLLKQK